MAVTVTSATEANKAVVRRFLEEVINRHQLGLVDDLFTADFVLHLAGKAEPLHGPAWIREIAAHFRTAFPDWKNDLDALEIIAEGDKVVSRWFEGGTHRGPFQGIPRTGRFVRMAGIDVFRFEDGRIAEQWVYADMTAFLAELKR